MVEVPIWVLVVMGLAIGLVGLMLWTNLRERPFRVKVPDLDDLEEALPSIAGMTRAVILQGNAAEIVQNGDGYFPALFADFAAAREAIHYETFIWEKGAICDEMEEGLSGRARQGVEVRLMVDAMGSSKSDSGQFERMREAGVKGASLASFSDLELLFQMALATVQKELLIQNPYFVPSLETIRLVRRAVARGVGVHVMVPGPVTDSPVVAHAGHRYFRELLDCGVHLYENQKTLVSQKILVIDGQWCHVGSSNFDDRSFEINEEAGLGIIDPACAETLKKAFEDDLKNCVEVTPDTWKKRCTFRHRMIDRACYLLSGQL
jgi:phosphatidylserine/phosphatidylglycerophosphate/cardiolipin synthase-like enzyme